MSEREEKWLPIETAPKDGTVIEIRCTYGLVPWYGLYRWTDTADALAGNRRVEVKVEPSWQKADRTGGGIDAVHAIKWRPHHGTVDGYRSPDGGATGRKAAHDVAFARMSKLPDDYFERSL